MTAQPSTKGRQLSGHTHEEVVMLTLNDMLHRFVPFVPNYRTLDPERPQINGQFGWDSHLWPADIPKEPLDNHHPTLEY